MRAVRRYWGSQTRSWYQPRLRSSSSHVFCNVGDNIHYSSLTICPDIDTIYYLYGTAQHKGESTGSLRKFCSPTNVRIFCSGSRDGLGAKSGSYVCRSNLHIVGPLRSYHQEPIFTSPISILPVPLPAETQGERYHIQDCITANVSIRLKCEPSLITSV